jgi:hypothetical protein
MSVDELSVDELAVDELPWCQKRTIGKNGGPRRRGGTRGR